MVIYTDLKSEYKTGTIRKAYHHLKRLMAIMLFPHIQLLKTMKMK